MTTAFPAAKTLDGIPIPAGRYLDYDSTLAQTTIQLPARHCDTFMRNLTLTPCEAEVMLAVWAQQAVTVQDVLDAIPRQLAYTTVMTTMKILEEKGFIERCEKRGRAYVYRAKVSSERASRNTVDELANRFFDGSVKSMVLNLIKTHQIKAEDLAELGEAIDALERRK